MLPEQNLALYKFREMLYKFLLPIYTSQLNLFRVENFFIRSFDNNLESFCIM